MKTNYQHLTKSQSLLWMGQELNPDSPMYNMVMTYELKVNISEASFKKAFQKLIVKYDALRSVFDVKDGLPMQAFLLESKSELAIIDFSNEINPKNAYKIWEQQQIIKKFNISKSLLDSALIKLADAHYIWYVNQHHLITDAWSNGLLFSAISKIYNQLENNIKETPILVDTPSYATYSKEEVLKRTLSKDDKSKAFWKDKLKEVYPKPNLYNQNFKSSFNTASTRHYINLGIERSKKLRVLANEKGVRVWTEHLSLYNIFLTTLFAYLYRISGNQKIAVGSPSHNRFSKKAKETVGYLVEIFPLLTSIDNKETFLSLLQKVQIESNNFLKHAKPGISTPELHRSFYVLFNYIHADYTDFNGVPVQSKWVHSGHHDPRHQIRLHVHDLHNTGEIQLYFDLNNDSFNKEKQEAIPKHFIALLDAFIDNKSARIHQPKIVDLKESEEIATILQKDTEAFTYKNLVHLIEQQVAKTPNITSIVFDDVSYTYQDLNDKANQLAHYLRAQNISSNTQVSLWLKRSPEYIISVLAVLKVGATYVSIPYNYPQERVNYIIENSASSLCIVHDEKQSALLEKSVNVLQTIDLWETTLLMYATDNPIVNISKETTAFLIYTSGSTGTPKGVKITHEAISNYIKWTEHTYLTAHQIKKPSIPLFTTIGFDITANAVFLPLICGGNIRVYQEKNTDIDLAILEVIEDNKVNFIKLTPAHLNFLKGKNLSENITQVMVVTGDEFKTELGVHIKNAFGSEIQIYNEYGPSEATIGCIYHKFDVAKDKQATLPIGLPIVGMKAYILDNHLNEVPKGVVGNLYLGGKGLSSGYWKNKETTSQKFIQHPFLENTKIYHTGDLVRLNDDGVITFLGRSDFQVKINGHRIELGEIEAKLLDFSVLKSCCVLVLENNNIKTLAAYFTAKETINSKELQLFLSSQLPRYMVPIHYKQLNELPLSANGKVDRKKLALLETETVSNQLEHVAPRNEIEEEVAQIWCAVFQLKKISVLEPFIELGGESLMAIQITTRISEVFEFKIPLNKIFELQTIANIANYIEQVLIKLLEE